MSSTARTTSVIQSDNFSAAEEYETDPIALFREVLLFFLSCQLHDRFSVHLFMLNYYIAIIFWIISFICLFVKDRVIEALHLALELKNTNILMTLLQEITAAKINLFSNGFEVN